MSENMKLPRCAVCQDNGFLTSELPEGGENVPCEYCQFIHGLPRPVVVRFADDMEQRLLENDYKGGWSKCSKQHLADLLAKASGDLLQAMSNNENMQLVTTRAADVANIAMMVANNEQMGLWPKRGYVIQEIDSEKFVKHNGSEYDGTELLEFPFFYVDRADHAENYESLQHACNVGFWAMEAGKRYRVIDYDNGGVQYIYTGGAVWKPETNTEDAVAVPVDRVGCVYGR